MIKVTTDKKVFTLSSLGLVMLGFAIGYFAGYQDGKSVVETEEVIYE